MNNSIDNQVLFFEETGISAIENKEAFLFWYQLKELQVRFNERIENLEKRVQKLEG